MQVNVHSDDSMLLMLSQPNFQFLAFQAPDIVEQRQIISALLFLNYWAKESVSIEKVLLLSLEYFVMQQYYLDTSFLIWGKYFYINKCVKKYNLWLSF